MVGKRSFYSHMEVQIHGEDRCWVVKGYKLCRLLIFGSVLQNHPPLYYTVVLRLGHANPHFFSFFWRGKWVGGRGGGRGGGGDGGRETDSWLGSSNRGIRGRLKSRRRKRTRVYYTFTSCFCQNLSGIGSPPW